MDGDDRIAGLGLPDSVLEIVLEVEDRDADARNEERYRRDDCEPGGVAKPVRNGRLLDVGDQYSSAHLLTLYCRASAIGASSSVLDDREHALGIDRRRCSAAARGCRCYPTEDTL